MNDHHHDSSGATDAADAAHWAALARYLDGHATPDERAYVERFAAASAANRRELAALRELWQLTGVLPSPARVDALWRGLAARLDRSPETDVRASGAAYDDAAASARRSRVVTRPGLRAMRSTPPARGRRTAALAASVALVAGAGLWSRTHDAGRAVAPAGAALAMRDVTTARGQHLHVRLEDGTAVDLAPETRLRVRASARGAREVELQGEALFTVTHDARRPFLVHTRGGVAEDLGTTFTVRAPVGGDPVGDDTVRVVVLAGLVSLRAPHAPAHEATELRPGQLGLLSAGGPVVVETGVDTAAYAAWTRGRLLFRQARLGEVARAIARWYDVDVRIPDADVAQRRVTLDMPARSLREVLGAVAVPLGLRPMRTGHTVVLTGGRTP